MTKDEERKLDELLNDTIASGNAYVTERKKDKRKIAGLLKRGCIVNPSVRGHYVTINGVVFNGFTLEEILKIGEKIGVQCKVGEIL